MTRRTDRYGLREIALGIALGAAAVAVPNGAMASGFGCEGLLESDALPSVEGDGGMFYRVNPDLMMAQGLTDGNIAQIAALSEALATRGTTLIYLPMPTKALGQPWQLPPLARDLGFDVDVATTVYDESLKRLAAAGVAVVNARAVLAKAGLQTPAYFGPDPRPSPNGTDALAQAVSGAIAERTGTTVTSEPLGEGEPVTLFSAMRLDLAEHCASPLPPLTVSSLAGQIEALPGALMDEATAQVALVGTDLTGEPALGFAARIQVRLGQPTANYAVPGGGPFAAIASYLTSDAFRTAPPAVLVWEHPIWNNLAERGDGPMQELIAAAGADCSVQISLSMSDDGRSLRADLSSLERIPDALMFETGGVENGAVRFAFENAAGLSRQRWLERHDDAARTGRFFAPMSGLWEAGAVAVDIEPEGPVAPKAALFACMQEGSN